MATKKQREAARKNIRKAQQVWQSMSSTERSRAQPEGRPRKKPGTGGGGEYYHIAVRPKENFVHFARKMSEIRGISSESRESAKADLGAH